MKKICVFALLFAMIFSGYAEKKKTALDYYNEGISFEDRENYYEASEAFLEAIKINPSFSDAYFHLSSVTYENQDYSLALTYAERAEAFLKENVELSILKGYILISLNRLEDAKKIFENVLEKYPNNVDARFGLAQIKIFSGGLDGAKEFYLDALKRESKNKKALLSLALLSAETGNWSAAEDYINQCLRYHSGVAEVHYLASYLESRRENWDEAERRVRSALLINPNFFRAYSLLSTILYQKGLFSEVIDVCDYIISRNRNAISAWYLKGLALLRLNNEKEAVNIWNTALSIDPTDEIVRCALELLVSKSLSLEDKRRLLWADFHTKKASEYEKNYNSVEARFEYQRALRINPNDEKARRSYAAMLSLDGLNEQYLDQLKFVQNNQKKAEKKSYSEIKTDDTVEAYEALLKNTLAKKWGAEPFYLDKNRWKIGIYSVNSPVQLIHPDLENVAAAMMADVFSGVASTSVVVQESNQTSYGFNNRVSGFTEAYKVARRNNLDYFVLLSAEETEREMLLKAEVYSARTGTLTSKLSSLRTGNDRFASVLRSLRQEILSLLPVRGKIIDRKGNEVLVDLGKSDFLEKDVMMDVVHNGEIKTSDSGTGLYYDEKSVLGKIKIHTVSEEISQGLLSQDGFYDKVNIGDEVVISPAAEEKPAEKAEKPKKSSKRIEEKKAVVSPKTPVILEIMKEIIR